MFSKKTLLFSIIENIEEIGEPINKYISKNKDNIDSFLDQRISKDSIFDILIDCDRIISKNGGDDNNPTINKLNEYGSVVVKIVTPPNAIDFNDVKLFISSVFEYSKSTNK